MTKYKSIHKHPWIQRFLMMLLPSIIFLFVSFFLPVRSDAENNLYTTESESLADAAIIDEQAEMAELEQLQKSIQENSSGGLSELLPDFRSGSFIKDVAKGNFKFSLPDILKGILKLLFHELFTNMSLLIKLLVVIAFCAILKNMQASFMQESTGELAFYVCYIVMVTMMLAGFQNVLQMGKNIIDSMVSFMHATIPVLISLLVSTGNMTSAGIFQPFMITMVEISATLLKNIFIPLVYFSAVLSVVDNISDKLHITKLAGFLKQAVAWSLGAVLTIFIAIVALQGAMGAVVDGVTSKTAKFAISTIIPVGGKILSDAAESIIGCTLLIKNATGLAAMLGIIAIVLMPILKMLAIIILYRLTIVIAQPLSDGRITSCLSELTSSMTLLLGIVTSVTFMFIISITVMISAGNISAMFR